MRYKLLSWSSVAEDHPIEHLFRKTVKGEQAMVARIHLEKGCQVLPHHHPSEQICVVLSGKLLWTVEGQEVVTHAGNVLVLPSDVVHGVSAIEDSEVLDILSPPGLMGVDLRTE